VADGDEADDPRAPEDRVAALETAVADRDARLAEQDARIAKLTEQVATLTELLGRNSKNSHLPPSSDGPGASGAGKPRGKSGRKRGGQKGHRGSHRELLAPERVDTFIELFPEACEGCADPLPRVMDAGACRHQQLDLRNHRPHLTEWRRHAVDCERCGTCTRAAFDHEKIPLSAFGPCLTATVAMLTGAYHLSRRKTQKLLDELFGITVSLGAISAMELRASEALKSSHEEALREVQYAEIKHTDATSWTRAGVLMSLWTLASAAATVYRIFTDGCRETIRPLFEPRLGVLISDRATVFGFWATPLRQISHAHNADHRSMPTFRPQRA
jgi:transposase